MKRLAYICLLLCFMSGCASQQKNVNLPMVNVDKVTNEVTLDKGQSCEIEFRTNASTGYWWQLTNSKDITVVDSIGKRYESDAPKGMVGASSDLFWHFTAVKKGKQTLHFVYARENVEQGIKERDVTVIVK